MLSLCEFSYVGISECLFHKGCGNGWDMNGQKVTLSYDAYS